MAQTSICHPPGSQGTVAAPGPMARRWLLACSLAIPGLYLLFFVLSAPLMGPADQDQFLVFHELQYWNAMLFGLAKQWTPVMCSGLSMAGEPQVPFMSLSMLLGYVLGPFWGIKLAAVLYFAAGWLGAYLYAGLWLPLTPQRALAAALFIGNGFFFCRLGAGHADFLPFLTLPLILWALHESIDWGRKLRDARGLARLLLGGLLLAELLSLALDGSPVAIIHLLFWVALYALALAFTTRSLTPPLLLAGAVGAACLLDAGYLWPMLSAQQDFPRLTQDRFTSALTLLWFALIPMRGKLLPANGLGYELSVYIGPVLAWVIWRQRHWCRMHMPASLRHPLLAVGIISLIMGMGSLTAVQVPRWMSLFDLLRPLPGFRSLWITGRYWGFFALPLSLLAAAALWRFSAERRSSLRLGLWMGALLFLQLGFQAQTIFSQWLGTHFYSPVYWQSSFQHGPERLSYVSAPRHGVQGQFITPVRGVVNCYDMDDFLRADISAGTQLVRATLLDGMPVGHMTGARFVNWSHLELPPIDATGGHHAAPRRVQWVLDQAYHKDWRLPGCTTARGARGNLIADCPAPLAQAPPALTFLDSLSATAAKVSAIASTVWLSLLCCSLLAYRGWRPAHLPVPITVRD